MATNDAKDYIIARQCLLDMGIKEASCDGEPLNVSEDGGASCIHVCICKGGGHAECASDAVARLGSVKMSKCVGAP